MLLLHFLIDIVFPKLCLNCGAYGAYVCKNCVKKIPLLQVQVCFNCGAYMDMGTLCQRCKKYSFLDGVLVVSEQSELLSYIIYQYKYKFIEGLYSLLASKAGYAFTYHVGTNEEWSIIAVPLHKKRQKWRGFNQCERIAQHMAPLLNIPIRTGLKRITYKQPQMELNKDERQKNIQGAFHYSLEVCDKKNILLVDDVITTGNTLNECARILKMAGYSTVYGLALTRGT